MMGIDKISYCSSLRNMHPIEKALLASITMLIVIAVNSLLISALVLLVMSWLIIGVAKTNFKSYTKILFIPLAFLLAGCLTIAINVGPKPIDYIYGFSVKQVWISMSGSSLGRAGYLFVKSLTAVSCLNFLALTTPLVQIIYICRQIKIPGVVIDLMVIIYSDIFLFVQKANDIYTAQLSRCGYQGFRGQVKSLSILCSNLFTSGLIASNDSFDCLVARGFTGQFRVVDEVYRLKTRNMAAIVSFDALLLLLHGWGRF